MAKREDVWLRGKMGAKEGREEVDDPARERLAKLVEQPALRADIRYYLQSIKIIKSEKEMGCHINSNQNR